MKAAVADPSPLGLMAFGMTTVLLNIHNAGGFELGAMVLSMSLLFGGLARVFAGWMEWKNGDTFATLPFSAYGIFWIVLVGVILLPRLRIIADASELASSAAAMGWFFLVWAVFSGVMLIATVRKERALQVVFAAVTVLFLLLAVRDFNGAALLGTIAGWEGIFTGLAAIYVAAAHLWNGKLGHCVLPVGSSLPAGPRPHEAEAALSH